jgi:nicotinamidase-related amidase
MLLRSEISALLIVDVQARLLPAIDDGERVLQNCVWLVRLARELGMPVGMSEQYPQGLGPTVATLRELVAPECLVTKIHFSCVAEGRLEQLPGFATRQHIVVAGTEAHVCVLHTCLDLLAEGRQVFVVADATGSRNPIDRDLALARLRQNGAQIVTREMVAFEWLRRAGTDLFRRISRDFIR